MAEAGGIRLVGAFTDEEIDRVRRMTEPEEIWQPLAFESFPAREDWEPRFRRGELAAFFVQHESHEVIGFMLNCLERFEDWGYVEFVVAITDRRYRRRGYGWQTLGLGMDLWFARGATVCFCTYSMTNPGSVGMARRIRSPVMKKGVRRLHSAASDHPSAAGSFTRSQWEQTKREIDWPYR